MKIALDVSPLSSLHSTRGIGSYTKTLLEALKRKKGLEIIPFDKSEKIPDADLIHYPYFDLFFPTLPIFGKDRLVITIHDVIPLVFPAYFPVGIKAYMNLILQKIALKKRANAVIADSRTSKTDIADKLTYPENKIHVVYLAQSNIFKPQNLKVSIREKYKLPDEFILYVGDVNWNKNILGLLEAVKLVNFPLVIVGKAVKDEKTPQSIEIKHKIQELKIGNIISLTGFVSDSDLVNIYNQAKLTVLPSFYEGFGLPVLESMACGTPVVCSIRSSLSEIGGPAVFCDPDSPADIANKISSVLKLSPLKYQNLREKSRVHAQNFNSDKVAQDTIKVYKSLLKT